MKNTRSEILLKDDYFKDVVKIAIKEKQERYDFLINKWKGVKSDKIITFSPSETRLHLYLDFLKDQDEMATLKRSLSSLKFKLNKSLGKVPQQTKWQTMFDYATKEARIEDIVTHFTGYTNFRRNIRCPFHEDKSPSMKVYIKTNSFYCFSCCCRGSPINFVKETMNCSFKEAVHHIHLLK